MGVKIITFFLWGYVTRICLLDLGLGVQPEPEVNWSVQVNVNQESDHPKLSI